MSTMRFVLPELRPVPLPLEPEVVLVAPEEPLGVDPVEVLAALELAALGVVVPGVLPATEAELEPAVLAEVEGATPWDPAHATRAAQDAKAWAAANFMAYRVRIYVRQRSTCKRKARLV
jgi:hypothetical protein